MSSDDFAIRIQNLGKCYQIYDRPQDRLKQSILPRLRTMMGCEPISYYREFWALKDVSLDIRQGETIGIIGRNGSGKSTLLQMICGTLFPTTGVIQTRGRIAALLELGAGFNPEFTGRENVYMNGTVLGLSQREIDARFDDIASFADIGEFIDRPVKQYSSGMYARLAFAVAINVDPDILVVDEALAVGDEPFQRKCFARIEQIKQKGGTILFVSHASNIITALCDRALLLHEGAAILSGSPKRVIGRYQKIMNAKKEDQARLVAEIKNNEISISQSDDTQADDLNKKIKGRREFSSGDEFSLPYFDPALSSKSTVVYEVNGASIFDARIESLSSKVVNVLANGERYRICYRVRFEDSFQNIDFTCALKNSTGMEFGGGKCSNKNSHSVAARQGDVFDIVHEFSCYFTDGVYFLNVGVSDSTVILHRIVDVLAFRVVDISDTYSFGAIDFDFSPSIEEL